MVALLEVLAPLLLAALVAWAYSAVAPTRGYRFRASSTHASYPARGWSGLTRGDGLFFHTKNQQDPWVDLVPDRKSVRRVTVWNRSKNRERAVPLVVEVLEGKKFREVGRRTEPFAETTFEFPPVETKRIRLRVDGKKTYLHLRRVQLD